MHLQLVTNKLRCLPLLQSNKPLAINHVKQIHAQLISNNLKSPSIFAKLIERYCAISPPQACLVLDHFHNPIVFLLNVLIRSAPPIQSIVVFANWVSKSTLILDQKTYLYVLGACARCSALWEGMQIHSRVIKHGFMSTNIMLQTTAIYFYANNKAVVYAKKVFDEMPMRSSATWNSLITCYCSNQHAREALVLFKEMLAVENNGEKPDETTMVCVLSAASRMGILETGTSIHGYIEKTIFAVDNNVYIGTGLVDMYAKCGCLDSASCMFARMRNKNVLTWTAMTTGLAIHGKGKQALELLNAMNSYGTKPNSVTLTSVLFACCQTGLVEEGLCLFHSMEEKFNVVPMLYHYGCVVDLLGKAGHLNEAFEFIISMQVEQDAVLWRSLLHACRVHKDVVMAEKVAKILITIQPEKNYVDASDMSEDYVAFSNICASAERWEDVAMVREMISVKGIETKPAISSVFVQRSIRDQ